MLVWLSFLLRWIFVFLRTIRKWWIGDGGEVGEKDDGLDDADYTVNDESYVKES